MIDGLIETVDPLSLPAYLEPKFMSATVEQLIEEARSLSLEQRERLIAGLIRELDAPGAASSDEIQRAWDTEIARRISEIESGKVKGIPAEEVFAKLRPKPDEAG